MDLILEPIVISVEIGSAPEIDVLPSGTNVSVNKIVTEVEVQQLSTEVELANPNASIEIATGLPGPPGIGAIGFDPAVLLSAAGVTNLPSNATNFFNCDCTNGNQDIYLPNVNSWIGRSIAFQRITDDGVPNTTSIFGAFDGITRVLYYQGDIVVFVGQANGWAVLVN